MGPNNIFFRKKFTRLSLMTLAFNVDTSVTQRDRDAVIIIIIRENLMGSEAEWAMGKKTTKAAVNSTRNLDI